MAKQQGLLIERILRDRAGIWRQIAEERGLKTLTAKMLLSSTLSLAAYGVVIGAGNGLLQAGASAAKLPLLFLATLAICLPTLYLFNLLFGARLAMMQTVALIMVTITVISVLSLAFAPISLFFLITAHNYPFLKLLNITILILTSIVGLRFLTSGMAALNSIQMSAQLASGQAALADSPAPVSPALPSAPPVAMSGVAVQTAPAPAPILVGNRLIVPGQPVERPASMTLLYIWILLFGFVGTQLAWTLRPFFGSPDEPFQWFRNLDGTFYEDVARTIAQFFGG
ncbi:MAG TPA: hypothetical protein VJY85_11265 [Candidatus Limnocylindria bacterium]|nr:hypothetical protein [Candidatus Limnocylindria bacterium]